MSPAIERPCWVKKHEKKDSLRIAKPCGACSLPCYGVRCFREPMLLESVFICAEILTFAVGSN